MWIMHVERVQGDYVKPEIIDLQDGSGRRYRLHETDISEDDAQPLADLLTAQAQRWAPRPPGATPGPAITVTWERLPAPCSRMAMGVECGPASITYVVDPAILTQRAATRLGELDTERSPHWQRVPKGYHDGDTGTE